MTTVLADRLVLMRHHRQPVATDGFAQREGVERPVKRLQLQFDILFGQSQLGWFLHQRLERGAIAVLQRARDGLVHLERECACAFVRLPLRPGRLAATSEPICHSLQPPQCHARAFPQDAAPRHGNVE